MRWARTSVTALRSPHDWGPQCIENNLKRELYCLSLANTSAFWDEPGTYDVIERSFRTLRWECLRWDISSTWMMRQEDRG